MKLYQLAAMLDHEGFPSEYFGNKEAAMKRTRELVKAAKPTGKPFTDSYSQGNGLVEVEVVRFTLFPGGFKETVLAALNQKGFILKGSQEPVYKWERPDGWFEED